MVKYIFYIYFCIIFSINIIGSSEDKILHYLVLVLQKFTANFIPIFNWKLYTNIVYIYICLMALVLSNYKIL